MGKCRDAKQQSFVNIEVICSDKEEHRKRIETRKNDIQGLKLPTWKDVKNREYHLWESEKITIDTANKSVEECFEELKRKITLDISTQKSD